MSKVDIHVPVMYIRWKVGVPDKVKAHSTSSCVFIFQSIQWKLCYCFSEPQHCVGLHAHSVSSSSQIPAYSIMLHVEDSDRRILPALSSDLLRYEKYYPTFFWDKLQSEVAQAYPEFRNKREMNFLLVLKSDDFLTDDSSACTLCKSLIANNVRCLESLSEDFSKLLRQDSNQDVEFLCAGQSIKAHQAVVSARSQAIASMLSSNMMEGITKVVKIHDMELGIFKQFLEYLYTGNLTEELSFEAAFHLYEAGDQYAVHGLSKKCSKFLIERLSVQNACRLLVLADAHSDVKFKEAVVSFMLEHKVPLVSDVWQDFCRDHSMLAIPVLNQFCQKLSK